MIPWSVQRRCSMEDKFLGNIKHTRAAGVGEILSVSWEFKVWLIFYLSNGCTVCNIMTQMSWTFKEKWKIV